MRVLRLLLSFVFLFLATRQPVTPPNPKQELAAHMIMFLDSHGEPDAQCTGTAVGPHAFMTAAHCNDSDTPDVLVQIDLSTKRFHLIAVNSDHRDHVIYLTDATFVNYVDVNERPAIVKEPVHMWGCGEGTFPPRELTGKVDEQDDKSDIDAADDAHGYSLHVIPGDSGSAIYGNDGAIVGLVTYSHSTWFGLRHTAKGFGLAFSPEALLVARTFQP